MSDFKGPENIFYFKILRKGKRRTLVPTDVWLYANNWEGLTLFFIFTRKERNMVGQPAMDNWDNEG